MHKFSHQITKNMDQKQLYEARVMTKPRLYNLVSIDYSHIESADD